MTAQRKLFLRCNEINCDECYEGSWRDALESIGQSGRDAWKLGWSPLGAHLGNRHRCPICADRIRNEEYAENLVRELR